MTTESSGSAPHLLILLICVLLSGCATTSQSRVDEDPWEGFNRGVYRFNSAVDRAVLKPAARGYRALTPDWLETGITNVFANLSYTSVILNDLLQGKGRVAARDTFRFLVNSTVGLLGFIDVASREGLTDNDEDFGQTLAVWGVPSGPYLVLPLFGPSTMRDTPGQVVGSFTDALTFADIKFEERIALLTLDVIETRARLLPLDAQLEKVFDEYAFVRSAVLQRRQYLIYDGNPPEQPIDEELLEDFEDIEAELDTEPE